jgi:hypothetical protein
MTLKTTPAADEYVIRDLVECCWRRNDETGGALWPTADLGHLDLEDKAAAYLADAKATQEEIREAARRYAQQAVRAWEAWS